jgi:hypothetical protein
MNETIDCLEAEEPSSWNMEPTDSDSKPPILNLSPESLPPSCRGPDGKIKLMTEEEHRRDIESTLRRLCEIAEIPNGPDDPPDEEWMRGIDEMRPHRPQFKGQY